MATTPEQVKDLLDRAQAALSQSNYDEAVQLVRQAVELSPRDWVAWRELGSVYGYAEQVTEMEAAFEHALRLAVTPDEEVDTWFSRGNAENHCDQWTDALRSFERVTELEPNWGTPWLMRGMILGNMGNFVDLRYHEEALVALDQALEMPDLRSTDERVTYSLKAMTLFALGRGEEAERCQQTADALQQKERALRKTPDTLH